MGESARLHVSDVSKHVQAIDAQRSRLLMAGIAAVVLGVIGLAGWMLVDGYNDANSEAIRSAENLASAFEHDVASGIESYNRSLQATLDGLKLKDLASLNPETRDRLLFDGAIHAAYFGSIVVTDATGKIRYSSQEYPESTVYSDRDYFRILRDKPRSELLITGPIEGRHSGEWSLMLSRRIDNPDGSFAGVVTGSIRLSYFQQLFESVHAGPNSIVALSNTNDRRLIVRSPSKESDIGRDIGSGLIFQKYFERKTGTLDDVSQIDHVTRIVAYRQVGNFPLLLNVGISKDAALLAWRRKAAAVLVGVTILSGLAAGLGALLYFELRRREQAEQSARESERRYRLLAENANDMITRASMTGERLYSSPACLSLFGFTQEEMLGLRMGDRSHPDDRVAAFDAVDRLLTGENSLTVTYRFRHKDGHYIWCEGNMRRAINPDNGEPEIVNVVRDIHLRKAVEEELETAKELAESANRAKSAFLANMSHELRTPLNAVIGFSDLMQRESLGPVQNPKYREYAADIRASGQHLLELINDILDHSKAESGYLLLDEEDVEIDDIANFVIRMLGPRAERAGLTVEVISSASITVHVDERRLRQILLNLVTNAVKFTPSGGRITINEELDTNGDLLLTVSDNGLGIAPEDQARIFEPFVQAGATNFNQEGTGLGLPLTKKLVELHGGTTELASLPGQGTAITVRLPKARVVSSTPHPNVIKPNEMTVLVVDDDEPVRDTAAAMLEEMGFICLLAASANQALAHLQNAPRIDLIFSDMVMPPGMNGTELAAKAVTIRPAVKVLLTTGFSGHILTDTGNVSVMHKPYSYVELKAAIFALFGAAGNVVRLSSHRARGDFRAS